jgi:hypothetical protein
LLEVEPYKQSIRKGEGEKLGTPTGFGWTEITEPPGLLAGISIRKATGRRVRRGMEAR